MITKNKLRRHNTRFGIRNRNNRYSKFAFKNLQRQYKISTVGQMIAFLNQFPKDMPINVEDGYSDSVTSLHTGIVDGLNRLVLNHKLYNIKPEIFYPKSKSIFSKVSYGDNVFWKRPPLMDNGYRENNWSCYGQRKAK